MVEDLYGSPAHAGIDLVGKLDFAQACCNGFPRTRGDRPLVTRQSGHIGRRGSPAHAGIDP